MGKEYSLQQTVLGQLDIFIPHTIINLKIWIIALKVRAKTIKLLSRKYRVITGYLKSGNHYLDKILIAQAKKEIQTS